MEWFFGRIHLEANLDDRAAPILIMRSELSERLERAGGQSGDVQISLSWNNRNDLDLSCIDPFGEKIWYDHKLSQSGGKLDVDSNSDFHRLTSQAVENIRWPYGSAPKGKYRVYVDHFRNNGDPDPTPFKIFVSEKGRQHEVHGSLVHIPGIQNIPLAYQFDTSIENYGVSGLLPAILRAMLITGCWAALLGLLFTAAIWAGQTLFFKRVYKKRWLQARISGLLIGWGALSGLLAGMSGQLIFSLSRAFGELVPIQIGRYMGWLVLGGLFGLLLSRRMPNLSSWKALVGGLIGGWTGAMAFLISLQNSSGVWGRLEAALLIGAGVGIMVTLFLPYKEFIEPLQDLRMSIAVQRLRPNRGSAVGSLKK